MKTLGELADAGHLESYRRWRSELPPDLAGRAVAVYAVLGEFVGGSQEKWVDDFCFDLHPDREIAIWECYARVFVRQTTGQPPCFRRIVWAAIQQCLRNTSVIDLKSPEELAAYKADVPRDMVRLLACSGVLRRKWKSVMKALQEGLN